MIICLILSLSLEKPIYNPKGYCQKYCKSRFGLYCCDSDHKFPEPRNLYEAANFKDVNWVKYFHYWGDNINYINPENHLTPLHNAATNKNIEVAKFILDNGGDINAVANNKIQPIHLAILNDNLEFIKLSLKYGSDVNSRAYNGFTPLSISTLEKKCHIVNYLLNNGADFYAKFKYENDHIYDSYDFAYSKQSFKSCLPVLEYHNPINKLLRENNLKIDEYKPILKALGVNKLYQIDSLKNKNIIDLFYPIEWSLTYTWLPSSFPCTPNCFQQKINLFNLINM